MTTSIGLIGRVLLSIVICVLAYILARKAKSWLSPSMYSFSLLIVGILALLLTWYLLFWFMALTTERVLAPWDQWAGFAPPKGAWQRQLNDFFSQDTNAFRAALVVVGISVLLFLTRVLRTANNEVRTRLPLVFAIANLAFLVTGFLSIFLVTRLPDLWLSQPRPSVEVGYHRTWPDILMTGVLLGLLFWVQGRGYNRLLRTLLS